MEYPLYDRLAERARSNPKLINISSLAALVNRNSAYHEIIASFIVHHDSIYKSGVIINAIPY